MTTDARADAEQPVRVCDQEVVTNGDRPPCVCLTLAFGDRTTRRESHQSGVVDEFMPLELLSLTSPLIR
jgi:hypothetical protein